MHSVFFRPDSELTCLTDVIVDPAQGIIVGSDGEPIWNQMDEVMSWMPEWYSRGLRRGLTRGEIKQQRLSMIAATAAKLWAQRENLAHLDSSRNYLYMLHPFGFYAFGHFFDSLQRLLPSVTKVPGPFSVLHSNPRRIVDFEGHMEMFGVGKDQLLELRAPAVADRLWISPWQSPPAQINDVSYRGIFERYVGLAQDPKAGKTRRIYLSRNHVRPGHRGVTNEHTVLEMLAVHGFTVVLGDEPLAEIVSLFHNAEFVVGPHGSLFANTMFCKPTAKIIEYCPENRLDYSFLRKTKYCKNYSHLPVPADDLYNIEIPLNDLLRRLLAVKSSHPV